MEINDRAYKSYLSINYHRPCPSIDTFNMLYCNSNLVLLYSQSILRPKISRRKFSKHSKKRKKEMSKKQTLREIVWDTLDWFHPQPVSSETVFNHLLPNYPNIARHSISAALHAMRNINQIRNVGKEPLSKGIAGRHLYLVQLTSTVKPRFIARRKNSRMFDVQTTSKPQPQIPKKNLSLYETGEAVYELINGLMEEKERHKDTIEKMKGLAKDHLDLQDDLDNTSKELLSVLSKNQDLVEQILKLKENHQTQTTKAIADFKKANGKFISLQR